MKSLPDATYFFPREASTLATKVDALFVFEFLVAIFFTCAIATTIVVFCIRYRRRPGQPRRGVPHVTPKIQIPIELTWSLVPLGLCMIMYFWGANLYVFAATMPENSDEVLLVAKQWMWKTQHTGGQREINELHVPLGRDVKLVMTSEDVIHSFFVPEFRTKMDVLPGRYTYLWFKATKLGEFHIFCAQYCGTQHSRMTGRVIVMSPEEYEAWLASTKVDKTPTAEGAELFSLAGCPSCHKSEDANRAPALEGVYGSEVLLADGQRILADEGFIRDHVVNPDHPLVAGYSRIMPSYRGRFTEDELLALVSYVKALGQQPSRPGGSGVLDGETR